MKFLKTGITALVILIALNSQAQKMNTGKDTSKKPAKMHDMDMMDMGDMNMGDMDMSKPMTMNSQSSLNLPMNRDGSGSSWVPDETPVYGYMIHSKGWMTMFHGSFFVRYTNQDIFNTGSRGGKAFDIPNWLMVMTQHKVGENGLFAINTMFSLDPFLVGPGGYPLLYQTGESYKGRPLVDTQHPHDLFAELSATYTQALDKKTDISITAGYPGEPALGPPVFMHRLSAMNDPDAPLSHHYADATHITFGVATLGFRFSNVKFEGSIFTGREPDEFRYNFDPMRFDSYSARISYNPSKEWALQVSNGWIHSPEVLEPQQNVIRSTASAIYTKMLNKDSYIATTFVYGQNRYSDNQKTLPSALLESSLQWHKTAIYGKYEYVQKDAEELNLLTPFPGDPNFQINALTLGVNHILSTVKHTNLTAGAQATLNFSPSPLVPLYGNVPVGFEVYLRITPSMMKM